MRVHMRSMATPVESDLDIAPSENKCLSEGFHAIFRLLSRLRELARRAQYAISDYHNVGCHELVYAFSRA